MEYTTLNNGVKMPLAGFGVYQLGEGETVNLVKEALSVGYRLIDTAQSYFNEEEVGQALQESEVRREDIFLTTKVWIDNYGYEKAKASVIESMKKLRTDYLDLVLLHQPFSDYYGAYRALEDLYKAGVVRAIGVSNFYPDRLTDITLFNEIKPQVNQVEVNIFQQQISAQKNAGKHEIQMEAWAPFGEGRKGMFQNPVLLGIAENHNKSVAQVILRWLLQRNIVSLCKSRKPERIVQNLDIFNFELSNIEMQEIAKIDQATSLFFDHREAASVEMMANLVMERRHY